MRFGLFVALLIPLIVVAGLIVPVPGGLQPLPRFTGQAPLKAQCVSIESAAPLFDEYFPQPLPVQLLPAQVSSVLPLDAPTYQAVIGPDSLRGIFAFSVWQPAGLDSIDLTWYHSPPIRMPAQGATRTGRVTRRGYISFYHALLAPDQTVRVSEVPCPPEVDRSLGGDRFSSVERPHN